jgi:hypothetical protein
MKLSWRYLGWWMLRTLFFVGLLFAGGFVAWAIVAGGDQWLNAVSYAFPERLSAAWAKILMGPRGEEGIALIIAWGLWSVPAIISLGSDRKLRIFGIVFLIVIFFGPFIPWATHQMFFAKSIYDPNYIKIPKLSYAFIPVAVMMPYLLAFWLTNLVFADWMPSKTSNNTVASGSPQK